MDNTAAVAYINKMGGTHSQFLSNIAVQLWEWYLQNNLEISAQHLPGIQNVTGFQQLETRPLDVSITSGEMGALGDRSLCILADTPDPLAVHSDAFSMNWRDIQGCAFPPFALIGRCLQQVRTPNVELLVLVAPVWPAQTWYPLLLHLCTDLPLLFPTSPKLVMKDNPTTGWMETICQHYGTADISEETRDRKLLLAAWRKNTTTYASAWSKWVGWCD